MISYIIVGLIVLGTIGAFSMNVESTVERNRQALVRKKSLPPAYRTDIGGYCDHHGHGHGGGHDGFGI
ncbi:MAG: hypothetical protein SFV17_05345 [Candidatus Obscuribacter sp.]|nr:hypothetical protein [Candidatus Melainabacteria bacterium]MDX1986091.1 hypothetical protein [Candidatus Obscuribacter sp.]